MINFSVTVPDAGFPPHIVAHLEASFAAMAAAARELYDGPVAEVPPKAANPVVKPAPKPAPAPVAEDEPEADNTDESEPEDEPEPEPAAKRRGRPPKVSAAKAAGRKAGAPSPKAPAMEPDLMDDETLLNSVRDLCRKVVANQGKDGVFDIFQKYGARGYSEIAAQGRETVEAVYREVRELAGK